jgi:hypothetical protein
MAQESRPVLVSGWIAVSTSAFILPRKIHAATPLIGLWLN